ncbi:MAG: IPT/TIG domain-containing protein [Terriglobales bacterium]
MLAAAGLLLVMAACGSATSNNNPPPAPTISSFAPASGVAGTSVVIVGTNLTGTTSVTFHGKSAASFSVDSATQITATVANNTTTGKILVGTPGGTATSTTDFTILNAPTITSFNPTSGSAGTSVTITGTNFTGATSVKFNSTAAASFTVNSATQITAVVASGTTTGKITVTTPNGSAVSATVFTVNTPAPTITGFNPGSGPVGTAVVIAGTNFTGATAVAFNGKAASSFSVDSATQITATVASGSTTGKISVTAPGGTATSANTFTVTSGGATLDLTIDGLYITQATQEYPNPIVPLVQNRSAWVRVFVRANQANTATPQVKVDFIKGATTNTLTINAGSGSVPLSIDPENAAASWNAAVSASWIQAGTQVVATVDPTNAIPEADETNNTFSQNLDVRNLKTWKVTLIPVHTGDGNQGVVENGTRTRNDWVDFAKRIHPVPDAIDVTVGSVMNSSVTTLQSNGNGWNTVLNELQAKRAADGVTDRYYYGAVHTTYGSGVAGLGFVGAPEAIGWDVTGSFPSVLAHEEGHNFGRQHSPCGNPAGVDPNYPYPGAIIGVPGWDVFAASNNLKGSSTYVDIMSYCSPLWVSDYTYVGVLNFRAASAIGIIVPGPGGAAVAGDGLLVWGRIENGEATLEPAFRIPANRSVAEPGAYTWEARDAVGRVLASVNFGAREVADLPDRSVQMFSFIVPLNGAVLAAIQSMHVKSGNQELVGRTVSAEPAADFQSALRMQDLPDGALQVVWDADRYPVLMLRDARTGEVRGFLRGGNAQIEGAPDEIEIHAPDGIRSEVVRHRRVPE